MQYNTILLVFDTLRKDFIYPYNPSMDSPAIREIVADSTVFPNAISPASWTPPAHASIFTGKYPSKSGIHEDLKEVADFSFLVDNYPGKTLGEIFSEYGYNTYKYSQNGLIGGDTGYSRGFNVNVYTPNPFQDYYTKLLDNYNFITSRWGYSSGEVFRSVLKNRDALEFSKRFIRLKRDTSWLKKANKADKGGMATIENIGHQELEEPFFMFVNLMDMHDPHDNVSLNLNWQDSVFGSIQNQESMKRSITESYAKAASSIDQIVCGLLRTLKAKGYLDNTVIAITSDHGQSIFEERGYYGHGNFLLDSIIDVPLIVKIPGNMRVKVNSGYQSTSGLYDFLPQIAMEGVNYDSLTSEVCFSESYGTIDKNVSKYKNKPGFQDLYGKINTVRKAVYKNGFKLVLDLTNGLIEEVKKDGKIISADENRQEIRELMEEIKTFSWNEELNYPF